VDGLDEPKAVILDLYPRTGRALRLLLAIDTDVRHSSANGISLQDIDIRPSENSSATANVLCDPSALEDGADTALGFKCQDGQFEQTEVSVSGNGAFQSGNHISLFGGLALGGWILVNALL
jgi:hypothetical protein